MNSLPCFTGQWLGCPPAFIMKTKTFCRSLGSMGSRIKVEVVTYGRNTRKRDWVYSVFNGWLGALVTLWDVPLCAHQESPPGLLSHNKSQNSCCNLFLTSAILYSAHWALDLQPYCLWLFPAQKTDTHKNWQTPLYV